MNYVAFEKPLSLNELEEYFSKCDEEFESILRSVADNNCKILGISDGRFPVEATVCFVEDSDEVDVIENVVYITSTKIPSSINLLTDDPRSLFIKFLVITQKEKLLRAQPQSDLVDLIHDDCEIHPNATIEKGVVIGVGTVISSGCVLKSGTMIGSNCIVRENTVIGCDGIALYKNKQQEVLRFPHVSGVMIGDNVEIGASVVIIKGTLKPTTIENDIVIGNLCNIGHGAKIANKSWLSVGTLIGGNTTINDKSTIGMGVRVRDNLIIGHNASIGMGSVVTKNIDEGGSVFGNPAKKIHHLKTGPTR